MLGTITTGEETMEAVESGSESPCDHESTCAGVQYMHDMQALKRNYDPPVLC